MQAQPKFFLHVDFIFKFIRYHLWIPPVETWASLPENGDCYAVRDERILFGKQKCWEAQPDAAARGYP
jgi:hypothetical protein